MQSQTAVNVYLKSKQLLHFVIARNSVPDTNDTYSIILTLGQCMVFVGF